MAGILLPDVTFELVKRLKEELDVPINLHSHATTGLSSLVFEQAMKAGVDIVDGCISPFSNGTSHIALETLLETAHVTNRETTLTHTALQGAYEEANELATKYIASGQYLRESIND